MAPLERRGRDPFPYEDDYAAYQPDHPLDRRPMLRREVLEFQKLQLSEEGRKRVVQ